MIYHTHKYDYAKYGEYAARGEQGDLVDLQDTVNDTLAALTPRASSFDAIVVTGLSGVVVGVPVSLAMGKPLLILRKKDEQSHSQPGSFINSQLLREPLRLLFLDDFAVEGETRSRVIDAVTQRGRARVTCEYLYKYETWDEFSGAFAA